MWGLSGSRRRTQKSRDPSIGGKGAPSRILAPIDLSSGSLVALWHAGYLADRYRATLDVLHVIEPNVDLRGNAGHGEQRSTHGQRLNALLVTRGRIVGKILARARCATVRQARFSVEVGVAADLIVQAARDGMVGSDRVGAYDLVVVGLAGWGQRREGGMGRVAARLIREPGVNAMTISGQLEAPVDASDLLEDRPDTADVVVSA